MPDEDRPAPPVRQPVVFEVSAKLDGKSELSATPWQKGRRLKVIMAEVWIGDRPPQVRGRPSSKALVREKAQSRLAAEPGLKLKALAHDLSNWLRANHPDMPQMAPATVADNIRNLWKLFRR